jgi:serine/threonine-protein kinase
MEHGELSPGDRCESYRIVRLIAAGGMGDVYEAVHDATGHAVALKCLKVRHRLKEDARARMKMEAVVLSELQHANLVQVYDAGVTESGMVWIAMERLHGRTLRELLFHDGALPVSQALYYACEIADGVDAVNSVNVVHRDLKPENVFVTDEGGVKVLDLGTGKFTGYGLNSTDRMRIVGTTAYMSPEQIKGLRVDARADVYALGLMVHEMITGRHALADGTEAGELPEDVEQMAMLQLSLTPAALVEVVPDLPVYVSTVVARALQKDREQRYPTMNDFARELRAARKRYIAENHEGRRDRFTPIEGLRHKLGAELPPTSALGPERTRGAVRAEPEFPTDVQARPPLLFTGPTPVPAPAASLPTEQISDRADVVRALSRPTDEGLPPDAVRVRTTNTNPLGGRLRSEPTLEPMSYAGQETVARTKEGGAWLSRPALKRIGATLALGAAIGIPPAVIGVAWTTHRSRPPAPAASVVAPAQSVVAPVQSVAPPVVLAEPAAIEAKPVASLDAPAPKASSAAKRPSSALVAPDWAALMRTSPAGGKQKTGATGGR